MAGSYRDLIAWKKAMVLVREIYCATEAFPREERYGLMSQLRRAAVSVLSNIAEGPILATRVPPFPKQCSRISRRGGNPNHAGQRSGLSSLKGNKCFAPQNVRARSDRKRPDRLHKNSSVKPALSTQYPVPSTQFKSKAFFWVLSTEYEVLSTEY